MKNKIILILGLLIILSTFSTRTHYVAEAKEKDYGIISAYNAEPGQTDSTPDITASGKKVKEGMVANNCLKFGTKVMIKEKIYQVEDRMNRRYDCSHYDIFMPEKNKALEFGRQRLEIEILI